MKTPEKLKPFECHGVEVASTIGNQFIGNCPFCGKEQHFYANRDTGLWDCKACGEEGNVLTFLETIAEMFHQDTTETDWTTLSRLRGLTGGRGVLRCRQRITLWGAMHCAWITLTESPKLIEGSGAVLRGHL